MPTQYNQSTAAGAALQRWRTCNLCGRRGAGRRSAHHRHSAAPHAQQAALCTVGHLSQQGAVAAQGVLARAPGTQGSSNAAGGVRAVAAARPPHLHLCACSVAKHVALGLCLARRGTLGRRAGAGVGQQAALELHALRKHDQLVLARLEVVHVVCAQSASRAQRCRASQQHQQAARQLQHRSPRAPNAAAEGGERGAGAGVGSVPTRMDVLVAQQKGPRCRRQRKAVPAAAQAAGGKRLQTPRRRKPAASYRAPHLRLRSCCSA